MVLIQVKCERSRAEAQAPKLAPCCSRCCLCGRLSSRTQTVSVPAQIIHALATRAGLHGHLVAVRRGFCGLGFREWWQCGHETGLPTSVDKGSRRPLRIAATSSTDCCRVPYQMLHVCSCHFRDLLFVSPLEIFASLCPPRLCLHTSLRTAGSVAG